MKIELKCLLFNNVLLSLAKMLLVLLLFNNVLLSLASIIIDRVAFYQRFRASMTKSICLCMSFIKKIELKWERFILHCTVFDQKRLLFKDFLLV